MEKLEDKKKKTTPAWGGGGSRGGLPRLYPSGSPGQRQETAGPCQWHSLPSRKRQGSHLGQFVFGSEEQHETPCPQPRSAAPGQRNEQAEVRRDSGTAGQTKGEIGGRSFVASGRSRPVEAAWTGNRSGDSACSGGSSSPPWVRCSGAGMHRGPSSVPGAVCPLPCLLRVGRAGWPVLRPPLSPYVCGPAALETRPSSGRPGALSGGFVAEVSLHIVGSPPLHSFFSFFFFPFLFILLFFFPSMRLQKVFGLSRFCGKRSLVKRRG